MRLSVTRSRNSRQGERFSPTIIQTRGTNRMGTREWNPEAMTCRQGLECLACHLPCDSVMLPALGLICAYSHDRNSCCLSAWDMSVIQTVGNYPSLQQLNTYQHFSRRNLSLREGEIMEFRQGAVCDPQAKTWLGLQMMLTALGPWNIPVTDNPSSHSLIVWGSH